MARIEVIDIGTVSVRMGISDVADGEISTFTKKTRVCDLGEGLDETGELSSAAVERVLETVGGYLGCFRRNRCDAVVCTLTQSAREASNAETLLSALRDLGLEPQVIDGQVEGLIAAYGVESDPKLAASGRTLVADSGGGSTELSILAGERGEVVSTPVGSRRVSERFFADGEPATAAALAEARAWCRGEFDAAIRAHAAFGEADRLVVCGGASTTLAAVHLELEPYNPALVHGSVLERDDVEAMVERFAALPETARGEVTGVHPDRAPVVLGSAVVMATLLEALGLGEMTVSEADNLQGIALLAEAELLSEPAPIAWRPLLVTADH